MNLHPEENALVLFDAIRMVHDPRTFAFEVKLLAANALKRAITGTHSQIGWLKVPLPPAPSKVSRRMKKIKKNKKKKQQEETKKQ